MNQTPELRLQPPANPFWEVFKTFGRDELTGGVVALASTAAIEGAFYLHNTSQAVEVGASGFTTTQMWLLALAGPVLEKVGFFFWHIKEARDTYNNTPVLFRKNRSFYIAQALRGGGKTLMWDMLLHDPLYVVLMLVGMSVHPATPAWLLVPVAFGLAVVAVAFLEVAINELRYWVFQRRLANRREWDERFELERYYDVRFYLDPSIDPEAAIATLRNRFLPDEEIRHRHYSDHYYPVELPEYNGRQGKLRVRCRGKSDDGHQKMISIQYIYSRTTENEPKGQYRFFPRLKDKHYCVREAYSLEHTLSKGRKEACRYPSTGDADPPQPVEIQFVRRMVYKRDTLYLAVDSINDSYCVIEVKAYPDKLEALIEAMHFVMHHFPAMQTTDHKIDLIEFE